jgi:hypothetical protein
MLADAGVDEDVAPIKVQDEALDRAAQVVASEVDEVRLENIAVWLKRRKVEAREERAQGQQEIAVIHYDSDLDFADSKAHGAPTPIAANLQH